MLRKCKKKNNAVELISASLLKNIQVIEVTICIECTMFVARFIHFVDRGSFEIKSGSEKIETGKVKPGNVKFGKV